MSGETVSGNALQFTNDNKFAYAYSGIRNIDNTITNLLEFNTNSEYLNISWFVGFGEATGNDYEFICNINNIEVQALILPDASITYGRDMPFKLIIPPFSTVKITGQNISSTGGKNIWVTLTGEVGMAPRVGNLVE
tara:strand:+ start:129 stop:536 length:408 start_codon:yes stop_codon:yes gene_type:complete